MQNLLLHVRLFVTSYKPAIARCVSSKSASHISFNHTALQMRTGEPTVIRHVISIGLTLLVLCGWVQAERRDSVFLLVNQQQQGCATGFLASDRTIITAQHAITLLCPLRDCRGTKVVSRTGEVLPISLQIRSVYPASDVAELEFNGQVGISPLTFGAITPDVTNTSVISYPRCGEQRIESGKLSYRMGDRLAFLTAPLAHGSSGGPVFSKNGSVIGIVSEAPSISEALLSLLSGTSFASSKIRIMTNYLKIHTAEAPVREEEQIAELIAEYESEIAPLAGANRLQRSSRFTTQARDLLFEMQLRTGAILLPYEERPIPLLTLLGGTAPTASNYSARTLAVLMSFERYGPRSNPLKPLAPQILELAVEQAQNVDKTLILRTARSMLRTEYRGNELEGLVLGLKIFALLAALGSVIIFSLGYVFAKTEGGVLRKVFTVLLVLVLLWPLSLVAWWFGERRRSRIRAKRN